MATTPRALTPFTCHQPTFYQVAGMDGFCHLCQLAPIYLPHQLPFFQLFSEIPYCLCFSPFPFFFLVTCKTINELQVEIWDSACNKLMHSFECIKQAHSSLLVSFNCALECQPARPHQSCLPVHLGHPLTLIHREAPCLSLRSACIRGCM